MDDKEIVTKAVDDIEHNRGDGAWNVLPGSWQHEMAQLPQDEQKDIAQKIIDQVKTDKASNASLPDVSIDEGFNKNGKTVDNLLVKDGDHTKTINIKTLDQHINDAVGMVGATKDAVQNAPDNVDKFVKDKLENP